MSDDSEPAVHGGAGTMAGGQTVTLHLVSHASGEMVEMIARNAVAQLDDVTVNRHLWKFVRNLGLVPGILAEIARCRGIVFHSIAATDIREALDEGCLHLRVPCIFVLEPFVSKLAEYSGAPIRYRTAARDFIDEDYYQRVEAMKYTLAHDDGQAADNLEDADVILVGVSRATKTPTCMYLASRGIKAANVPVVPGVPLPDGVLKAKAPLVVGLTLKPKVLAQVRSSRLQRLAEKHHLLLRGRDGGPGSAGSAADVRPPRLADDRRHQPADREYRGLHHRPFERAQGGGRTAIRPFRSV
ncbi:MAG: kinase/pyrophosphorylase [Rhodospirillales bacterium]